MHNRRKCHTSSRRPRQSSKQHNYVICINNLTVAFGLGILDRLNQMALEVQVFMPLVTMICLPLLSLIAVQYRQNSQETVRASVSGFVLSLVFLTSCALAMFGEVHGRYFGLCKLFSRLGGTNVKAKRGWAVWITLLSVLTAITLVLLALCASKVFHALPIGSRGLGSSLPRRSWFRSSRKICVCWTLFSCGLWATCVASVELNNNQTARNDNQQSD